METALGRCAVVLVVLAGVASAFAESPILSGDQQRRLDAGEVVLLDVRPPGASESAQGGTAVAFVCAPASAVWDIVVDWRNHPALYPYVTRAEATQTDPSRVRVRYTLAVGPLSFDVFMDKYPDAMRRRVTWRLAEDQPSTFFAESSGYWHVDEAGAESRVTYAVASRTMAPAFLTRGSQRDSLVSTVQALRRLAQKVTGNDARTPCASGR
jgi:hypothetical protein